MNGHIYEYIKIIKKKNINVGITTNGNLLSTSRIDELLDTNINMIQVSLNCFQEHEYNRFMHGGDFKKVIANLEYLSRTKQTDLVLQISILNQLINKNSRNQLIEFAEKRGDLHIFQEYSFTWRELRINDWLCHTAKR